MKKIHQFCFLAFILLLGSSVAFGQSNFVPQNMGPGINTEFPEISPVLSPDGKTIYFVRLNHPENNYGTEDSQDIWYAELKEDGTWGDAQRMPAPFNVGRYNSVYSISEDGNTIVLNGIYSKKGKWIKRGLSTSRRDGDGWSIPERIKVKGFSRKNKGASSNVFLSADGQVLFLNFTKKFNGTRLNIYVSQQKNGKWKAPKKLRKPVNTRRSEESPFLSSDGKTLYFSSNRAKNKREFNIYSCERLDDTWRNWSEPKLLEDSINNSDWQSYFKTNRKGSLACFASRNGTNGEADLFTLKLFEENPFVVIKGKIVDSRTKLPIALTIPYSVYINDVKHDSLHVDPVTGVFQVKLPLGKSYILKATAENYTPRTEEVNVTSLKEYTELNKDLMVDPIPYVLVEGSLLVADDKSIVPDSAAPKVFVNNVIADSAIIDLKKGLYRLKLPYGQKYAVQLKAKGYTSVPQTMDFSSVKEFKKVESDLLVERMKAPVSDAIIVSGKVINVKGNVPADPSLSYEIRVNDLPSAAVINKATAEFTLTLPPGGKYTINAAAENFYPVYEVVDLTTEKGKTVSRNLHIAPIEVGQSVKLNNILFETGKATLKKSSYAELDKVVKFLKDNSSIKIEIGGHTDNVGNADANQKLSQDRAVAVANYIILSGITKERIKSKGFGMTMPVASNKTAQGKSLNRRVEFTILEK